jgi:hypothetical protein
MDMIWHLTFSAARRNPLFPDNLRLALHKVAAVAGPWLLYFCIVDDHLHVLVQCTKKKVGRIAAGLLLALRPLAHPVLLRAHVRRVETRAHLDWLVDRYLLQQAAKHGLGVHPALHEGSCFQELARTRGIPGLRLKLWDALPRYRVRRAFEAVGLEPVPLEPADDETIHRLGLSRLCQAGEFAVGGSIGLVRNVPSEANARRAIVQLAQSARLKGAGDELGLTRFTACRLRARPAPPEVVRAIRSRLALEERTFRGVVSEGDTSRWITLDASSPPS